MTLLRTYPSKSLLFAVGLGVGLFALLWVVVAGQSLPLVTEGGGELLAIYALALDNDPTSPENLTAYYTPTLQSIISATINAERKAAIVLADLDGYGDTRLLIVKGGVVTPVDGLPFYHAPSQSASIQPALSELDMADGAVLGALIRWARQLYPAEVTLFSFVGHGAPLAPAYRPADIAAPTPEPGGTPTPAPPLNPLPPRWAAHAGLTDFHSASLLSVHDLANALRIGTDNGQNPLTVLDLLHCFSASIEELYEVHPYTKMVVASPNYAYAQPAMLGAALQALQPTMPATTLGGTLVQVYDSALPVEGHPRLMVAVEGARIAPIKAAWDQTAQHLYGALGDDPQARAKITGAYTASAKYDTTLCDAQDWRLQPPDALSDMADFADQLSVQFGAGSPVSTWAITTTQRISEAITARAAQDGSPWFVETTPVPHWRFDAPGISLFTDFAPLIKQDTPHFSWQAHWYTDTASSGNPYPFAFIQGGEAGIGWADIFSRFWAGQIISTTNCLPSFIHGQGQGELALTGLQVYPAAGVITLTAGAPITVSVVISSAEAATNPLLRVSVYQNEQLAFVDVVGAGYLAPHMAKVIDWRRGWTPAASGLFTIQVEIDADKRFIETNEGDNMQQAAVQVELSYPAYLPLIGHAP